MLNEALNRTVFGNRLSDYLVFVLLLLAGFLGVTLFRRVFLRRLRGWARKTETTLDDFLIEVFRKSLIPLAYYGVFSLCTRALALSPFISRVIEVGGVILMTLISVQFTIALLRYGIDHYLERKERDPARERALKGFHTLIKVVVWGLGSVFLLDNLGFRISAVVTGLGIGGVAVALASQAILGDLFSYFTIMFDRPFEVGDFIVVGDCSGVVEHLGIKSARIGSLGGEQIVISNKDLTDSRVRNYKRMERRRVPFRIGVTYRTSLGNLKEMPGILEGIIRGIEGAVFDRAHFFSYGDSSLIFEVVYHVVGNDYSRYMDIQQEINIRIAETFAARGIEFAYPTRTLFVHQET